MKTQTKISIFLAGLVLTSPFSNSAMATMPLWKCTYKIYNTANGADANNRFWPGFFLRDGHTDLAVIANEVSSLKTMYIKMETIESCGGPDSCSDYGHATGSSSGRHHDLIDGSEFFMSDDEATGLRFGDKKVFGLVTCAETQVSDYYLTPSSMVLITPGEHDNDNFNQSGRQIYAQIIGVPGACAGGDLNAVAKDISSGTISSGIPFTSVSNMKVTADGKSLAWTEISAKCTKWEHWEDDRGAGESCVKTEETGRRNLTLPKCAL